MSAYFSSEKTCNLCHGKGTCGTYRPLIIFLINHSNTLGKDYDEIFGALAYICDDFTPLPGGGEGTTEYVAGRHEDDNCIDECPLCEEDREKAEALTKELKGFDE